MYDVCLGKEWSFSMGRGHIGLSSGVCVKLICKRRECRILALTFVGRALRTTENAEMVPSAQPGF